MSQVQNKVSGRASPVETLDEVLKLWVLADKAMSISDATPTPRSPQSDPGYRVRDPDLFAEDLAARLARFAVSEANAADPRESRLPSRGSGIGTTVLERRETIAQGRIRASATDVADLQDGIRTGSVKVSVGQLCRSVGLPEPQTGERYELVFRPASEEELVRPRNVRRVTWK
ncbi:C-4 methylsterol oxidase [Verticillium dahliae VDG1]|nr:C-4 methylsterol oxidase [Verticillium dahliae VDG1]